MLSSIVYIIDDEQEVLESLQWLIQSVGYQAKVFNNAENFLRDYDPNCLACLVLDVRMPKMSGLELQEILIQKNINIPLIFMTGHGDVSMAVKAMKQGAVDFLTKPVNNQLLIDCINHALRLATRFQEENSKALHLQKLISRLTPRELEVMQLVISGKTTKVVAETLGISPNTAELHRAKVMKKMQVKSLAELITLQAKKVELSCYS